VCTLGGIPDRRRDKSLPDRARNRLLAAKCR
jgi:hypothetical protein